MVTFQDALDAVEEERGRLGVLVKQFPHGMHRICELELLGMIAKDYKPHTYIELGCGKGYGMAFVKQAHPEVRLVGYESWEPTGQYVRDFDIFSPSFLADVTPFTGVAPLFVYTDNGHKITELKMMSTFIKKGDIIGTHDWPNEVCDETFMLDLGFVHAAEYDEYINKYASLQRFWKRP